VTVLERTRSVRPLRPALALVGAVAALGAIAWWQEGAEAPDATAAGRPWVAAAGSAARPPGDMVLVPGARHRLGGDGDAPAREVELSGFLLDRHEVTNRQFARFVAATGHRTTAEEQGGGWVYRGGERDWLWVRGADWRHPLGPESSIAGGEDYPVVLVSWHDAETYARWAGKRLPSEWEWEAAARAGGASAERSAAAAEHGEANVWQGVWPRHNRLTDGFLYAAPVGRFGADRLGAWDLIGNVWEWTASAYGAGDGRRVARGGSWFCSAGYCSAYRPGFRGKSPPGSAFNTVGFRCARSGAPAAAGRRRRGRRRRGGDWRAAAAGCRAPGTGAPS
jgi:formylglycine-generating enzyme required for sulfatase activity